MEFVWEFHIFRNYTSQKPAEGDALTEGVEVCLRKRLTNRDPHPRGRYG